jgi:peptide/nickel transport system ATP-binding protein
MAGDKRMTALLEVKNLVKHFPVQSGIFSRQSNLVKAVNGVSFSIEKGQTLGLVGESGCGKSTLGKALMHLHSITYGSFFYNGKDITHFKGADLKELRKDIQIIFQDPYESLNPRHNVATIIEEPFIIHKLGDDTQRKEWVKELLQKVGLPESALTKYPHEFSGGQRQRIGIARAIALKPKLIICDEAVSALDVSVQSQIINLLLDLQKEMDLALLFIAHDLAAVKHVSDNIAVMYLGQVVEIGPSQSIYNDAKHPYTQALISAIPQINRSAEAKQKQIVLSGDVPSPLNLPEGCLFHTRCPVAKEDCKTRKQQLATIESHEVACHYAT